MSRLAATIAVALGLAATQACATVGAAAPTCDAATRVTRDALTLMAGSARDESTQLQRLVRKGWDTPYDDLTISRSFKIGECRMTGDAATVDVTFDVIGRLVAAGQEERVAFQPAARTEKRALTVVSEGAGVKLDDLGALEPHVGAEYAIGILTELGHGAPAMKSKFDGLIAEIRTAAARAPGAGA